MQQEALCWEPTVLNGSHPAARYLLQRSQNLWPTVKEKHNRSARASVAEFMSGLKVSDLTNLPSTWRAAAAALPAAGRGTSSFRYQRGRGQMGWLCSALAASAQVWTSCCHQSSLRWSPERGCLSLTPSARRITLTHHGLLLHNFSCMEI